MGDDVAGKDYVHEVARVTYGLVARPEKVENRIEENQPEGSDYQSEHDVEQDDIAQNVLGALLVALPEAYRRDGRAADTYQ